MFIFEYDKIIFMNRAYKFRIYPNKKQIVMFAKTFGCVRFIYNKMLADKIAYYKETGKNLYTTPAKYKNEFEWLKEIDSLALANAQLNLETAYRNFFRKNGAGFPKFKSKKLNRMRYTTNNQNGSVRIENGKIRLPKVGFVKIIQHRSMIGKIKSEKKLSRSCRWLSRKIKGGKNREKARLQLCRIYEKITEQRTDFLNKKSYRLAEEYDAVYVENLDMKAMSQALKFGKSVSDNSYGKFIRMLDYKLSFRGKRLIKVDKWYPSSQLCSECGYKNPEVKNLTLRSWKCPECGAEHDRDINAAKNIRDEGKRKAAEMRISTVGHTGSYACGEDVSRQVLQILQGLVQSSKKQEAPAYEAGVCSLIPF